MSYDAIVLGGGAAGLFCAAQAGQRGRRVLVVEHNARCGRKILISGGGRANFTNLRVRAENFLSANPHFARSALARYTPEDFIALVRRHGIRYHEKTLGQLFCDNSAAEITAMLEAECRAGAVEILTGTHVGEVNRAGGYVVETSRGRFESAALVVATGGLSIPKIGASDLGYRIAERFGLKIEPPYPALVPLTFSAADRERWGGLAGVSAEVEARIGRVRFREKMLFTHRGLSGPAILQISSYWRAPEAVTIDLLPGGTLKGTPPHEIRRALAERLPRRLAERWLEVEGFTQPVLPLARVEERLHNWRIAPEGTEGFEKAEVTGGGVSTEELSSKTMEARRAPGLFFIGEVVDVTGWLGGYNFQWAWSSAYAAAQAL